MRIEIRKVCVNDAMAICQISSNDLGYPCTPELVEAKLKKLDHGREEVFVAVARDKVVGYLHVEKYDVLYAGTMANILGLAVELDHRKQGVGKLLVGEAERWAINHDIHAIRLNSGMSRKEAHKFYRNIGYVDEKDKKRFMKMI